VTVAVTGSEGTVGTVLRNRLGRRLDLRRLDLPGTDVRDYAAVARAFSGAHAVVHLAWNTVDDNYLSGRADPGNALMFDNVYRAAVEVGVPRVVMASSVHADDFEAYPAGQLVPASKTPAPASPYGAGKVRMEALGREYAACHGLEVVCLRLGAVVPRDGRPRDGADGRVWLHHGDLADLVLRCLTAPPLVPRFQLVNAVSRNPGRVHDTSNALGWTPGRRQRADRLALRPA
jgi:nucleoside-diphosphate-sugar epimerase